MRGTGFQPVLAIPCRAHRLETRATTSRLGSFCISAKKWAISGHSGTFRDTRSRIGKISAPDPAPLPPVPSPRPPPGGHSSILVARNSATSRRSAAFGAVQRNGEAIASSCSLIHLRVSSLRPVRLRDRRGYPSTSPRARERLTHETIFTHGQGPAGPVLKNFQNLNFS